jgi:hypothetical protein
MVSYQICSEFEITEYLVWTTRNIKDHSVLPSFTHKKQNGKRIFDGIITHVTSFYEDDEYGRICPGMKDFVGV